MFRTTLKSLIPYISVREDLRIATHTMRGVFRSLCAETLSRSRRFRGEKQLKLNIGCGDLLFPGWVNIDEHPPDGAYYVNVLNGLPFDDASAVHIHCEHFLEHLDFFHAKRLLSECSRVLEPGGTLRLIVPDAEKYCRAYCRNDRAFFKRLEDLGGVPVPFETPMRVINQMFRMGGAHKFAWDYETLKYVLEEVGFSDVTRSCIGAMQDEYSIDGTDWWREVESLYVNTKK